MEFFPHAFWCAQQDRVFFGVCEERMETAESVFSPGRILKGEYVWTIEEFAAVGDDEIITEEFRMLGENWQLNLVPDEPAIALIHCSHHKVKVGYQFLIVRQDGTEVSLDPLDFET